MNPANEPFLPKTYVTKPIRIAHQPSEHEIVNYFLEANNVSGHVSIEDGFSRIVPVDMAVIPEFVQGLKDLYNAFLDYEEKIEAEFRASEVAAHAAAIDESIGQAVQP